MKISVYKLLSIVLAGLLVVTAGFYGFERWSNARERRILTNQIADLEGTVQETETAYSRRAVEIKNLKLDNKELRQKIEDRDEEAVALAESVLKWKDKYIKIKNATETVVDPDGDPNTTDDIRIRVDFEKEEDPLRVSGFTLTNPPEAEVSIEWMRDLKLSLILTKDDDDLFRVYLDTDSPDIVPSELKLSVDPSILDRKWYEKIGVDMGISGGEGVASTISLRYDVFNNWSIGPSVVLHYDGQRLRKTYGISTTYYPFR